MRFRSLAEWLAWQESLHPRAIDLGLERVQRVAAALGVGEFDVPVITVGGTNGKGSCVAMLESILHCAGYRAGAFTSPHLTRYNERIRIDGAEIRDAELLDAFTRIDAARGDTSLTFFEFNTLAALLAFGETGLDVVILEVGLGGRLDAVNIVDADVALLTSIGLDHCDWLGSSLEAIGEEKAGIFRAGRPAVLGSGTMPDSVRDHARLIGARLREPGVDFSIEVDSESWTWSNARMRRADLPLPSLLGAHQVANAGAVLAVLEELRERLPVKREAMAAGLDSVSLPGRFQRELSLPEWIFDVAHNPDAAGRLAQTLASVPKLGDRSGRISDRTGRNSDRELGRTIAVVGILKDKDAPAIVGQLRGSVDRWIGVGLPGPRGMSGAQLREACGAKGDESWSTAPDVATGCEAADAIAGEDDRIVVFGSFHTVGPALEWLRARHPDGRRR